jgi:hypothetical protein
MRSLAAFLCFLALVCGNNPGETLLAAPFAVFPPIEPVPTQAPRSTPMPAPQVIAVGEQVTATPLAVSAAANPAPPSPEAPPPSVCTTPDPFIGIPGLIGVCVGGGWVPVGHPLAGGGG